MFRHVPNIITGTRLVLACVFFVILSFYQYDGRGDRSLLIIASVIYLLALITDFFDGYLARKWKVEGVFGRIVDPFVDKILVLGSFIFFAGKNFIIPETETRGTSSFVVYTITGVTPFMVIVLLGRELLVTTLRGLSESAGKNFGAQFSGKFKMVAQSVTILIILLFVDYYDQFGSFLPTARLFRDICIWLTLLITVVSGLLYVRQGVRLYFQSDPAPSARKKSERA